MLAEYKNPKSLEEKIEFLIENPKKAEVFANNAYKFVKENYSKEILKKRLKKLLENI